MDLFLRHTNELKNQFFLHSKVEDVQSIVDPNLLPLEYGGKMPMADMVELFKKELEGTRDLLLSYNQLFANNELRSSSLLSNANAVFEESFDIPDEHLGVQGSFRKLEID